MPFEPEDIALTPGAFGALATAFRHSSTPVTRWWSSRCRGSSTSRCCWRPTPYRSRCRSGPTIRTSTWTRSGPPRPANPGGDRQHPEQPDRPHLPPAARSRHSPTCSPVRRSDGEDHLADLGRAVARLVFSDAEFRSPSEFYPYTLDLLRLRQGPAHAGPAHRLAGAVAVHPRPCTAAQGDRTDPDLRRLRSPTPSCSTRSATSSRRR